MALKAIIQSRSNSIRYEPVCMKINDVLLTNKRNRIFLFFLLTAIECLAVLFYQAINPTRPANMPWPGFSTLQLVFLVFSIATTILFFLLAFSYRKEGYGVIAPDWFDRRFRETNLLLWIFVINILGLLLAVSLLLIHFRPINTSINNLLFANPTYLKYFGFLSSISHIAAPTLTWITIFSIQTLATLSIHYKTQLANFWRNRTIMYWAEIGLIISATFFHFFVLILQLKTFLLIPGWKWYFFIKSLSNTHWFFLAIMAITFLGIALIFLIQKKQLLKVVILIVLGITIQVGFGFVEGKGFESLRIKRYVGTVFNYAEVASHEPDIRDVIFRYEEKYGSDWYLGTKPPGLLLGYIATERISGFFNPETTPEGRFLRMTTFASVVFPFISFLVIIPLYFFSKSFFSSDDSILPGLLFIVCPSVILIPLFFDQVFYPLFFVCILLMLLSAIKRNSALMMFITGCLAYLAVYFSFSLLPLIPLAVVWLGVDYLINHKGKKLLAVCLLAFVFSLGLLIMLGTFRIAFNYDFFQRYAHAMELHRRAKEYIPGIGQLVKSLLLNNAEMLTWTGFPITILFCFGVIRSFTNVFHGKVESLDPLLVAFVITYLALNIFGQTNGEVQRLWLFLVPIIVLFSAREVLLIFNKKSIGVNLIILLQLVTIFLIFRFQDFYA